MCILPCLISVFDHYPEHRNLASAFSESNALWFLSEAPRPPIIFDRKGIDDSGHPYAMVLLGRVAPLGFNVGVYLHYLQ